MAGAGRGLLEVVEGEVLPQRDFLHHDRHAEELEASGVSLQAPLASRRQYS